MGKRAQIKREKQLEADKRRRVEVELRRYEKQPWLKFWLRTDFWVYTLCLLLLIAFPFLKPSLDKARTANAYPNAAQTATIKTQFGDIKMELYKADAPKTVANFSLLAKRGYYNGLTWHRVIKDFVIQGGDPKGDGSGGESAWGGNFEDEINPRSLGLSEETIKQNEAAGYKYNSNLQSHKMEVGSVAMANSGPNTNGSQFFIVTENAQAQLDGKYTVFGKVTSGMDVVRQIAAVEVDENSKPKEPVYINTVEVK
jgi:cyclophilin family peptidyl-prolyl cis-trans isomerase